MMRDYKPLVVVTEAGGLKNAIGPFLKERMNQRGLYVDNGFTLKLGAHTLSVTPRVSAGRSGLARGRPTVTPLAAIST
jgi:hypothetical protein